MKIKFLLIAICTLSLVHAQDYYPLKLGNQWVYDMLAVDGSVIGVDTTVIEELIVSGDTTFFHFYSYRDSLSGGSSLDETLLYNGISDANEIYRKATNKLLLWKHQYVDGEIYGVMGIMVQASLIGDYVIGNDTFPDCYWTGLMAFDSTGTIVAPDIGPIAAIETGITVRELRTQNMNYVIRDSLSICDGDSVLIHAEYQKESGTYIDSLTSVQGGDSILMTTLTVNSVYETHIDVTICDNEFYFAGGENQNTEGTYYDTLSTIYGCDSVIITDLTVNPIQRSLSDVSICEGEEYFAGGENQTDPGEYYDTLSTVLGCDSIVITNLTVKPASDNSVDVEICEGDSHFAGGAEQTTSGTYYDTLTAINGCDSILTTNLTVSVCGDALDELSEGNVLVYPNPSSGMVYVEAEIIQTIQLYNLTGELQLETSHTELDLNSFSHGTYIIRVYLTSTDYVIRKIVLEE